ncbi:MAG: GNAT family N-acetyltransferase [Chloroflexi bacterium]|nr:GNAT family N-acetyltransferase [Chloroflexota bacterium]
MSPRSSKNSVTCTYLNVLKGRDRHLPENYTIVEASVASLDAFILLLEEVGAWLWDRGVKQWAPGSFTKNRSRLEHFIEHGCLVLAYRGTDLVGGCILSEVNPGWPEHSEHAMYLNSLAVARSAAGKRLGTHIINTCIEVTGRRCKTIIRLDCWDGNDFLKSYYRREGFTMLEAHWTGDYTIRFFEMQV